MQLFLMLKKLNTSFKTLAMEVLEWNHRTTCSVIVSCPALVMFMLHKGVLWQLWPGHFVLCCTACDKLFYSTPLSLHPEVHLWGTLYTVGSTRRWNSMATVHWSSWYNTIQPASLLQGFEPGYPQSQSILVTCARTSTFLPGVDAVLLPVEQVGMWSRCRWRRSS